MSNIEARDVLALASTVTGVGSRRLTTFDAGIVTAFHAPAGASVWERHPGGDELLYVVEGELDLIVLDAALAETRTIVPAGSVVVIPKSCWHRPLAMTDVALLFVGNVEGTEQSEGDPRES